MKVSRERYQHGSVRKVSRSQGFAWEFRFYLTAPDGKRKLKVQTFDSLKYPTERDVRKAVEGQLSALNAGTLGGKLAATMGTIIERYMAEDFLTLRHSTQTTNKSLINLHIKPRWEHVRLADVSAMAVKQWLDKLPFGAASKARTRNMVSKLLELAMLWEYIPVGPLDSNGHAALCEDHSFEDCQVLCRCWLLRPQPSCHRSSGRSGHGAKRAGRHGAMEVL
jgi:hypothetical protein